MTNGEKIQTILDVDRDCTEVHGENGTMTFTVTQDFWNTEYKEPKTGQGMKVNICGVPHTVIECEDKFDTDCHFGQIGYKTCEIRINKDLTEASKKETICHEMVHGMLIHLGYQDQSNDEQFVQSLGNAIYQGFDIKVESEEE